MSERRGKTGIEPTGGRPRTPHLGVAPRVQGGAPLGGGPRLDLGLPLDEVGHASSSSAGAGSRSSRQLGRPSTERIVSIQPIDIHESGLEQVMRHGQSGRQGATMKMSGDARAVNDQSSGDLALNSRSVGSFGGDLVPQMPIRGRDLEVASSSEIAEKACDLACGAERVTLPMGAPAGQIACVGLKKTYHKGKVPVPVLKGIDLAVQRGELVSIVGQSGSGKSTLLHLLATLDSPDQGAVFLDGARIDNVPAGARDRIRNQRLGMIFQFYHLLPELSTLENVLIPLMIGTGVGGYWRSRRKLRQRAAELLERVGLGHRLRHKPRELSGGEMQRAAIARALIAEPEILLADEPTGNLDKGSGDEIIRLLRTLNDEQNLTIVLVTHDLQLAHMADRMVQLVDGRVEAADERVAG